MNPTKENVIKAWKEGCDDVKSTLETLYPDTLPPKVRERNITCELKMEQRDHLCVTHNGDLVCTIADGGYDFPGRSNFYIVADSEGIVEVYRK